MSRENRVINLGTATLPESYDREGLHAIAEQLRQRAERLSIDQPLASVLPSLEHWQQHSLQPANGTFGLPSQGSVPELLAAVKVPDQAPDAGATKGQGKKGRRGNA